MPKPSHKRNFFLIPYYILILYSFTKKQGICRIVNVDVRWLQRTKLMLTYHEWSYIYRPKFRAQIPLFCFINAKRVSCVDSVLTFRSDGVTNEALDLGNCNSAWKHHVNTSTNCLKNACISTIRNMVTVRNFQLTSDKFYVVGSVALATMHKNVSLNRGLIKLLLIYSLY
jgi:hypothetical protein